MSGDDRADALGSAPDDEATYESTVDQIRDELGRLDLQLRAYLVEWWTRHGSNDREASGLYVSDAEVVRLLRTDGRDRTITDEALHGLLDERTDAIHRRSLRAAEAGVVLRLDLLQSRFELSDREREALVIALAPEVDRKYETIYASLQDDLTKTRPTVGFVLRVLSSTERDRLEQLAVFSPSSPLVAHGLVDLDASDTESPSLSRVVTLDRRIVAYLLGVDDLDPVLRGRVTVGSTATSLEDLGVDSATEAAVDSIATRAEETPLLVNFSGPYGAGSERAVAAVCTAVGVERLVLRADDVPSDRRRAERFLDHLCREATLRQAAIHLTDVRVAEASPRDVEPPTETPWTATRTDRLVRRLDRFDGHVFLTGPDRWRPVGLRVTHEFAHCSFPRPDYARRRDLWAAHADALPAGVTPAELASRFRLTAGQIRDALDAASATTSTPPTPEALFESCRAQSSSRLETMSTKIEPTYTWRDIVLPPQEHAHLEEVAGHVRSLATVYGEWGFGTRFSLGRGLTVLFSGPSGTGKTMAAEIIAGDAGLDLYKIDLASVVSKYIGETEKNLREIFDEAEHTNAILLFDEADAIFGKRSETTDAQDRYANIEVNYLLQRIEEHDGVVVLTTNFEQNIDDAFLRRIHVTVEFPRPDREARERIWETIFPAETPRGDLDVQFLAGFELTGGSIRNVVQNAAFLAAATDQSVEMPHLVHALKREFQKTGTLVDPAAFGDYRDALESPPRYRRDRRSWD